MTVKTAGPKTAGRIPTAAEQPLIVARETFKPLGLSETTGYELIRQGTFPLALRRQGGRWFALTREFRDYIGLGNDEAPASAT